MNPVKMLVARLANKTQKDLARELGVSIGYLNDVLHERREPGPKVLDALNLQRRVVYEKRQKRRAGELL